MTLPTHISTKCPNCEAPQRFYRFESATDIVRRTCRKCKTHWSVKIKPVKTTKAQAIHVIEWIRIGS